MGSGVGVCGVGKSIVEHLLPTTYQKRWGGVSRSFVFEL